MRRFFARALTDVVVECVNNAVVGGVYHVDTHHLYTAEISEEEQLVVVGFQRNVFAVYLRLCVCRSVEHCGVFAAYCLVCALRRDVCAAPFFVNVDVFGGVGIGCCGQVEQGLGNAVFKLLVHECFVRDVVHFGFLLAKHRYVVEYHVVFGGFGINASVKVEVGGALDGTAECKTYACPSFVCGDVHFRRRFGVALDKTGVLFGSYLGQVAADCHACMTNLRRTVASVHDKTLHAHQTHAKRKLDHNASRDRGKFAVAYTEANARPTVCGLCLSVPLQRFFAGNYKVGLRCVFLGNGFHIAFGVQH